MDKNLRNALLLILACQEALQVMKSGECLDGSEVVDIESQEAVSELREERVIELEEGELVAIASLSEVGESRLLGTAFGGLFEAFEHLVGTSHDRWGHAGKSRHMDTKTMFRSSRFEFTHEHDFAIDLAD